MTRVSLDFDLRFPNGVYIFNALGQQISPKTREGKRITQIYEKQKVTRKENKAQTKKVELLINKDIDGDRLIGDKPILTV